MTTRRNFITTISLLFGTSATTVSAALKSTTIPSEDLGLLVWTIETFGAEATAQELLTLVKQGDFSVRKLKQNLNKNKTCITRLNKASERREAHAGNTILYHGPLQLTHSFAGRVVLDHTRREVLVGTTDKDYTIRNIGKPAAAIESYYILDDMPPTAQQSTPEKIVGATSTTLTIPKGARILLNGRFGFEHDIWACEVVVTAKKMYRIHLWQTRNGLVINKQEDSLPYLAGGFFYSTEETPRTIGLLGLPLTQGY